MPNGRVDCARAMDPRSPSNRRRLDGSASLESNSFGDIESVFASMMVAKWRHSNAMLVLRGCSRRFRDAIDGEIDAWCRKFGDARRVQDRRFEGYEEYYKKLVRAETMLVEAFGSAHGMPLKLMAISIVDRRSYMALLTGKCLLCGGKYNTTSDAQPTDAEESSIAPCYVFGHKSCQRKHMVVVADSIQPIQKCSEPRSLHKELCTVSHTNKKGIVIDYSTVKNAMSSWYNALYAGKKYNVPIVVWLSEHPLVRRQDTLYGALGITREDVDECMRAEAESALSSHQQLEQKRAQLAQAKECTAAAFKADLRVWLGRGYTRWRSIEDMDAFHPRFLQSTCVDQFVEPMPKRNLPSNLSCVFYMLMLFNETLARFEHALKPVMLQWVVAHLGVDTMFNSVPFTTAFSDDRASNMDIIAREAAIHARVLAMLANCGPDDIKVTECKGGFRSNEISYNARLAMTLSEPNADDDDGPRTYQLESDLFITERSLCKFKYIVYDEMDATLASTLPPVPARGGESEAGEFLSTVVKACFFPQSKNARIHALALAVATCVYSKVVSDIRMNG